MSKFTLQDFKDASSGKYAEIREAVDNWIEYEVLPNFKVKELPEQDYQYFNVDEDKCFDEKHAVSVLESIGLEAHILSDYKTNAVGIRFKVHKRNKKNLLLP